MYRYVVADINKVIIAIGRATHLYMAERAIDSYIPYYTRLDTNQALYFYQNDLDDNGIPLVALVWDEKTPGYHGVELYRLGDLLISH